MVEHVQRDGDTLHLAPGRSIAPGENIVPMGAEARAGDVIVPAGTRISAAQIAAAAACGAGQLSVYSPGRGSPLSPPATNWSKWTSSR